MAKSSPPVLSGILSVDKPLGWTSHDVVGLVRRLVGQRQVGHAGTLDPLASGVLLVVLGTATRLSDALMHTRKCYAARLRLGATTTTDDAEGETTTVRPVGAISPDRISAVLSGFLGEIAQTPPAYAAIKKNGVPAYKLARQGEAPVMEERQVRIDGLALTAIEGETLDVIVWCSAGTYIRALARDIGEELGCGAHLASLRRLSSGPYTVARSRGVQELRRLAEEGEIASAVDSLDDAVAALPVVVVPEDAVSAALHGNSVFVAGGEKNVAAPEGEVRLYTPDGRLLGLGRYDARRGAWQPHRVFLPAASEMAEASS